MTLRPVSMDFNYGSSFGERSPSAYETLLLDAIIGDATLYTRQDMVEASWTVVEPIQQSGRKQKFEFPELCGGHVGARAADEMLARRGHVGGDRRCPLPARLTRRKSVRNSPICG